MSVATVGLNIAKQFFQVHGVDAGGRVVLRKKLRGIKSRLSSQTAVPVGLEACCGSHYWVRVLSRSGHRLQLIAPQFMRYPLVRGSVICR